RYAALLNERSKGEFSVKYSQKAITLAIKNKDKYAEAISYNELGFSYKNFDENQKSIAHYNKAFTLFMSIGCYREAVHARYNMLIILSHNDLAPAKEQIKLN